MSKNKLNKVNVRNLNIQNEISQYANSDVQEYENRLKYYFDQNMISNEELVSYKNESGVEIIETGELELQKTNLNDEKQKIKKRLDNKKEEIEKKEGGVKAVKNDIVEIEKEIQDYIDNPQRLGFSSKRYKRLIYATVFFALISLFFYLCVIYKSQGKYNKNNPLFDKFDSFSITGLIDVISRDPGPVLFGIALIAITLVLYWYRNFFAKNKIQIIFSVIIIILIPLLMEIMFTWNAVERLNLRKRGVENIDFLTQFIEYIKFFLYPVIPFSIFNLLTNLSFKEKKKNSKIEELENKVLEKNKEKTKLKRAILSLNQELDLIKKQQEKKEQEISLLKKREDNINEKATSKLFRKYQLSSFIELNEAWINEAQEKDKQTEGYKNDIHSDDRLKKIRTALQMVFDEFINNKF